MNGSIHIISDSAIFEETFKRCCQDYNMLQMYVAWVGQPFNSKPFSYLDNLSKVSVTLGYSLDQSHPEGIRYLMQLDKNLRIVNQKPLFHPKIYIFSKGERKALIIGSSNFTFNGFNENIETSILIEGKEYQKTIKQKEREFSAWNSSESSFLATEEWLKSYSQRYALRQKKLRAARVKDEATNEEESALASSWINKYDWASYVREILKGIEDRNYEETVSKTYNRKVKILEEYQRRLPLPWSVAYFDDIENRRMMLGIGQYAWLGHVGASRRIQHLLAKGSIQQKRKIIEALNTITAFEIPIDWKVLQKQLEKLTSIGPTIKVWGRFLAIIRPDIFCTFSSPTLRTNLSRRLKVSQSYLGTVEGYIQFLKIVHSSPWYNSPKPTKKSEVGLWNNRVAFLDEVLY